MVSSTSTKGRNTTSKETANNKSSSSERRPPNSACRSHQLMCEPTNQEVSGESANRTSAVPLLTSPVTALERSRWRGGSFACYAPHVMPQRSASRCGSRACWFSKYRKTNSLQVSEKIEFPYPLDRVH